MVYMLGANVFDIDIIATKAYYDDAASDIRYCSCPSCRNFCERQRRISYTKERFFKSLGIHPEKASVVWAHGPGEEELSQRYMCLYPIVASAEVYTDVADQYEADFSLIEKDFSAAFFVKDGKPYIVVNWTLPWVRP
ncbi:MAG: hypothetical protein IKK83_04300 [Clostridia bacterium]|nr:hypothetical protein [Clostridia bacterium]